MLDVTPIPAFDDNYIWMIRVGDRAVIVDPGDPDVVTAALEAEGLTLDTILITHHHGDHTGGVEALVGSHETVRVIGPQNSPTQALYHDTVGDGDHIEVLGLNFSVLGVPGHTLDHIAYVQEQQRLLFCGDTLFVGGCGRLFEGSAEQMQASLAKLVSLPQDTRVFCAHEYTQSNLRFASHLEPANQALSALVTSVEAKRTLGEPTVPSSIAQECATNPFVRWGSADILTALKAANRYTGDSPAQVLGAVRSWKDEF